MPQETSENLTAADLRKQIEETEVEVEAEAVETPVETEPETTAEETTTEEVAETPEVKEEEPKEPSYKLKVEGREEELPLPKVLEYAQKGRYLEREMAKLKAEREALKKEQPNQVANPFSNMPVEKVNEWLIKELNENPMATLMNLNMMANQQVKAQEVAERKADKEFEIDKAADNSDIWPHIKSTYRDLRDVGYSREQAFAMAEADFWKDVAVKASRNAETKTKKKVEAKKKADMPMGDKRTKPTVSTVPSAEERSKMTAAELKKALQKAGVRVVKNPGW